MTTYLGEHAMIGGKSKRVHYKMTGEFRAPQRGEHYISGAIPVAYKAWNDLSQAYNIAVECEPEVCPHCKREFPSA